MDTIALCPFRRDVTLGDAGESATCGLLATAFGSAEDGLVRIGRDVCAACCRLEFPADAQTNPVVASLIYLRAHEWLKERPAGPDADRFARLKANARCRLAHPIGAASVVPGALGVVTAGERRLAAESPGADRRLTWAVAVLTAPRRRPTLSATLTSLHEAGYDGVHVFAESAAEIPGAGLTCR